MEESGGLQSMGSQLSDFTFTFHFHALEKEMTTHSSILAWRIPGMAEPGGLLSTGSHRVRHDSATKHTHIVCMNNFHQVTEDYDYRVISMLHLFSFCMHSSVHLGYNFA